MGNQQLSNLKILCRNAILGDGYLWKHPECVNYKLIFTSTNKEWLGHKMSIAPDMFPSGVKIQRKMNADGCFHNSKTLYRLASLSHPIITKYKNKTTADIISELTKDDMLLWYVDDGCAVKREYIKVNGERSLSKRYILCIGMSIKGFEEDFLQKMKQLYNAPSIGKIKKNGSKASENNKIWLMPSVIGKEIESSTTRWKP